MRKNIGLFIFILVLLQACNGKKLTEVVEVPLPNVGEKISIGKPDEVEATKGGAFDLMKLPFKYDALQPSISALTVENHYSKHYLTYTNNFNKAVAGTDLEAKTVEEILAKLDMSNEALRNNAGGYYNHQLYFECLGAKKTEQPKDTLLSTIKRDFGSYENFIKTFKSSAERTFGSGWTWLVVDKTGTLQVTNTPNQDNPLMPKQVIKGIPILALDLWEHAYYLDYQFKRRRYIDGFFNLIDWKIVGKKYEATF